MAFETGTATSISDLFTKLSTFAVANGWTEDHAASDRLFLHRNTVYVAFRWASASPVHVGIYQALGFISSGTNPGAHTDDSGNGAVSGTDNVLDDERNVNLVDSTMTYWFFEDDVYIHVVAEVSTGVYRHFGFGEIAKLGTWTGGEYCYGWRLDPTVASSTGAVLAGTSMLLDGLAGGGTMNGYAATIHIEGAPGEGGSSKWGVIWGNPGVSVGNDTGGNARVYVQGGFRSGPHAVPFGRFSGQTTEGLIPAYPIHVWYKNPSTADYYPLGYMEGVRGVNIRYIAPEQEVVIGSDTWVFFPTEQKTSLRTDNQGIMYLKVP